VRKRAAHGAAVLKQAPTFFILTFVAGAILPLSLAEWRTAVLREDIEQRWLTKFAEIAVVERRGNPQPQWTPSAELEDRELRGKVFRIADLADARNVVRDRSFVDCDIYGPAVVLPNPETVSMLRSIFFAGVGLDSVFLRLEPGQAVVDGVIRLENCTFERCRFIGVGITGSGEVLDLLRKGFGPS
jgi:hypothetical protein